MKDEVVVPFPSTQTDDDAPSTPAMALSNALAATITLITAAADLVKFAIVITAMMLAGIGVAAVLTVIRAF